MPEDNGESDDRQGPEHRRRTGKRGRADEDRGIGPPKRRLKQRVRSAGKRTPSSARWLERQLNDPYVAAARNAGYRSRAAFKLIELDDKFKFLKPGRRVVDLGAAPGGWTQVAVERVASSPQSPRPLVLALDVNPMDPVPGAAFVRGDVLAVDAAARLRQWLDGGAHVVLSDMAAPATGHKSTDHLRVMALCEQALDVACEVLAPGGAFVAKVLQGGTERDLLQAMKVRFDRVHHAKPAASRRRSSETYVVARGFRGRT